jgi:hypothetical protein
VVIRFLNRVSQVRFLAGPPSVSLFARPVRGSHSPNVPSRNRSEDAMSRLILDTPAPPAHSAETGHVRAHLRSRRIERHRTSEMSLVSVSVDPTPTTTKTGASDEHAGAHHVSRRSERLRHLTFACARAHHVVGGRFDGGFGCAACTRVVNVKSARVRTSAATTVANTAREPATRSTRANVAMPPARRRRWPELRQSLLDHQAPPV